MKIRTLAFAILTFFSPLFAEINYEEGVVYAFKGNIELKLDIAYPASGKMHPCIIFIHGGAWRAGTRKGYRKVIRAAANRGYVAATVDYRLTGVAPWPAQIEDVREAFLYLIKNASKYGIDPERVGAIGDSAGGHLSLMLGLMPGEVKNGPRVRCIVILYCPTDLSLLSQKERAKDVLEALLGEKFNGNTEAFKKLSPISYIDRTDPPVLTFHGTEDPIVPFQQAKLLHAKLKEAGVPNRLVPIEGAGHGFRGRWQEVYRKIWNFFGNYLIPTDMPLVAADDFDKGAGNWEPTDKSAWKIEKRNGDAFYALFKRRSSYKPPFRSPYNISLLKDVEVTDFVMDIDLRSTITPYGHQDLCVFFGYQDPAHFYYVHIGRRADSHANSIFIVNKAPRVSIAKKRTKGTNWSKGWHWARVIRDTKKGTIQVFFDDMENPIMSTVDKTFLWGRVGVGSFDDTGEFDAFRLWGKRKGPK